MSFTYANAASDELGKPIKIIKQNGDNTVVFHNKQRSYKIATRNVISVICSAQKLP